MYGESPNDKGYFGLQSGDDTAAILLNRAKSFYTILQNNAWLEKLNKMWRFYHGAFMDGVSLGHEVTFAGEQGELVHLPLNHFRNIARHIFVMITSNRPIMEARAVNTDYKSLSQAYLATGILEYYMREKGLEDCLKKAVELSIVMGAGYVKLAWNATAGEEYDYDETTGQFNYDGDLEFTNLNPLDVVMDGTKETWDNDWIMTRTFKNKYDLIAKYPEFVDKLKNIASKSDSQIYRIGMFSNDETDDIPVYEFYHRRTEALPEGRYMLFCSQETVLLDTKLPYRTIPIFRIVPSEVLGTPYGYTPMFDLFPIQEAVNSTVSSIMTNQNAFAVQSLYVPRGADIAVNSLGEGMNIIEGNSKPEALQMTATAPETFNFLNTLVQSMETISGVNSVARGNPESSLKSGNALALVQSMSLQFMSELQQNYVKLVEDVGSAIIEILKDFASTPREIAIVGKNNRTALKEFSGDDVSSIKRVYVDVGNPLSRTISGRVQMAEQLLQMKLLTSPDQYFMVLNTGKLEMTYEGDMQQLLLIKLENEMFLENKSPIVVPMDKHALHIQEHTSVLGDPELRQDPAIAKIIMDHIEDHMNALQNTDPRLLQILGQQPIQPLPPPPPPPGSQPPPGAPMPQQGAPMGPPPSPPPQQMGPPQGQPPQQGIPHAHQAEHGGRHPMNGATVHALKASKMHEVLGLAGQEGPIHGGSVTNPHGEHLPHLPKVKAGLLPNPDLQEQSLGNVK